MSGPVPFDGHARVTRRTRLSALANGCERFKRVNDPEGVNLEGVDLAALVDMLIAPCARHTPDPVIILSANVQGARRYGVVWTGTTKEAYRAKTPAEQDKRALEETGRHG